MSGNGENDFMFEGNPDACPVCDRDEIECVCAPEIVMPARWEKCALAELDNVGPVNFNLDLYLASKGEL